MTSTALEEFGYEVKQARLGFGWNLEKLATEVLGNGARKGYVGQIEKGKRNLSPETIDKFDQVLDLSDSVVKAVMMAPKVSPSDDESDLLDQDAGRLLTKVATDETIPQMGESLLVVLAYEFAGGKHLDLQTAYVGLRNALEAAERIQSRGELPPANTGSQLNAVLAEVAQLNADGDRDGADTLFEIEEDRMRKAHIATRSTARQIEQQQTQALLERRLDQDRLRNDHTAAAKRLIKNLVDSEPTGSLFMATRSEIIEQHLNGLSQGDPFTLQVALEMAEQNAKIADRSQKFQALTAIGNGHYAIGQRSKNTVLLDQAETCHRQALIIAQENKAPHEIGIAQTNVGTVLIEIGDRKVDLAKLTEAVDTLRLAADAVLQNEEPQRWANRQRNLASALLKLGNRSSDCTIVRAGIASFDAVTEFRAYEADTEEWAEMRLSMAISFRCLGQLEKENTHFSNAEAAYHDALKIFSPTTSPYNWAKSIGGLGELALDQFSLDNDLRRLSKAEKRLMEAHPILHKANELLDDRCANLLDQIAKARANAS
ncbi:MAG: transcriptional regulator with XRE-family HTH domain [Candidatus Azotimanducaceae bacterium]|jgi:transcriptional regulator with XRE-family HTH domain